MQKNTKELLQSRRRQSSGRGLLLAAVPRGARRRGGAPPTPTLSCRRRLSRGPFLARRQERMCYSNRSSFPSRNQERIESRT
uniref:Uncharacterized protein n=1 Tax=Arundo donax TaxID=35708 RepID=A0A0A9DV87_ARUDO